MEVDRNDKMSSGRTYNWHSICLRWSDLLTLGSHFSQTFYGIARYDYQLMDLHAYIFNYLLIINLMNLSASNDVSMIFQGTVEERN